MQLSKILIACSIIASGLAHLLRVWYTTRHNSGGQEVHLYVRLLASKATEATELL